MSTPHRFERVLATLLTTAAVAMAAVVVYRELTPRAGPITQAGAPRPEFVPDWRDLLRSSRALDNHSGKVQIIEFTDFECPACRRFHQQVLPVIRERFGREVAVAIIHLPLQMHRFANISANAAECAAEQGAFPRFVDVLFAKQDSIGLVPWTALAATATLGDTTSFGECVSTRRGRALVDSGTAIAQRRDIQATPTIIVNGWRLATTSTDELIRVVSEIRANRSPYD